MREKPLTHRRRLSRMAKPSLDGVRLKLTEADKHLDFLRAYRIEHVEMGHRGIVGQYEPSSGDYVFRVDGKVPPPDAGVRVSIFAHLLRSSLDNLLWQLILARGGKPRTEFGKHGERPTQFPIYEDEAKFNRQAEAETNGVEPPDFALIQSAQPYKAGPDFARWHPLAMLGHLNNVDKHRFVHPTFAAGLIQRVVQPRPGMKGIPVGRPYLMVANGPKRMMRDSGVNSPSVDGLVVPICPDGSVVRDGGWSFLGSDDDPTEVARVRKIRIAKGRKPKMEMQPTPMFDISFSDRDRPMIVRDLEDIRAEVLRIVNEIDAIFPK